VSGEFAAPAPTDEYPFLLTVGTDNHFWHTNNIMKKTHIPKREYNALLLLYPKGLVEISAEDAARIGVRDKRPVKVVSASGSMQVSAKVSADVRPGSVYVPYFVEGMIPGFLEAHGSLLAGGEDSVVPVRIERV
jgi:anaerobic selenocysteine-containing dehydrogenase